MSSLDRRGSHIAVHWAGSASAVGTGEVDSSLGAGVVLVAVVFGTLITRFLALFLGYLRPDAPALLAAPLEAVGTGSGAGPTSPPALGVCYLLVAAPTRHADLEGVHTGGVRAEAARVPVEVETFEFGVVHKLNCSIKSS